MLLKKLSVAQMRLRQTAMAYGIPWPLPTNKVSATFSSIAPLAGVPVTSLDPLRRAKSAGGRRATGTLPQVGGYGNPVRPLDKARATTAPPSSIKGRNPARATTAPLHVRFTIPDKYDQSSPPSDLGLPKLKGTKPIRTVREQQLAKIQAEKQRADFEKGKVMAGQDMLDLSTGEMSEYTFSGLAEGLKDKTNVSLVLPSGWVDRDREAPEHLIQTLLRNCRKLESLTIICHGSEDMNRSIAHIIHNNPTLTTLSITYKYGRQYPPREEGQLNPIVKVLSSLQNLQKLELYNVPVDLMDAKELITSSLTNLVLNTINASTLESILEGIHFGVKKIKLGSERSSVSEATISFEESQLKEKAKSGCLITVWVRPDAGGPAVEQHWGPDKAG